MDAKTFFDNFGLIASAPNGVEQLRGMILQLAVQGKLSSSLVTDAPAQTTLDQVAANKADLLKLGAIRSVRGADSIAQTPKFLPDSWLTTTINEIAWPQAGFAFKSSEFNEIKRGLPLIRIRDISNRDTEVYYSGEYRDEFLVKAGDYLVAMDGNFNLSQWNGNVALLNQRVTRLVFFGEVNEDYVAIALKLSLQELQGEVSYTTVDHLSTKQIANITIPLPPRKEQDRIVATVEHLLEICDRLEALNKKREKLQARTNQTILSAIPKVKNKSDFEKVWERLSTNLHLITAGITDLGLFRRAVFDLGTLGYFSPEESLQSEQTGQNVLDEIQRKRLEWLDSSQGQERKEALAALRKLKKHSSPELHYKIPSHWAWATLLQTAKTVVDCHNKTAPYINSGIHLIRTSDVRNGTLDLSNTKKIDQETYDYWSRRMPPKEGDIIFTREAPMGEAAIIPNHQVCLGQRTMLVRLFGDLFSNQFLVYVVYSSSFIEQMESVATGTMVKHLRVSAAESLPIPVPPVEEQLSVVKKISSLIDLLGTIEAYNQRKEKVSLRYSISAIKALTGLEISRRETMKAPKTEVITELSIDQTPPDDKASPLFDLLKREGGKLTAKALWQSSDFGESEINQFYQQLSKEMHKDNGWIKQGEVTVHVEQTEDDS